METFIRTYTIQDLKLCDDLIAYFKKNTEYKQEGTVYKEEAGVIDKNIKESIDVRFFNGSHDLSIQEMYKQITKNVYDYVKEFKLECNLITENPGLIQWYPIGGGFKTWHFERCNYETRKRQIVYMLYLNDVEDGGTEWYFQKMSLPARKGTLVLWPSDFTHVHKGIVSNTKEKFIATGWLEHCL